MKLIIASLLIATASVSADSFSSNDFTFSPPTGITAGQVAHFYLDVSDGFAPNVNIQKQQYQASLEDYKNLSLTQFKQLNWKVIGSSIINNQLVMEYSGLMENLNFHFYTRAFKKGNFIYIATGTSLQTQWPKVSKKLKQSVNSFAPKA